MIEKAFLLPGDELVSGEQNTHFHRGMRYKVANCYVKSGSPIYTLFDKWGQEVRVHMGQFEMTAKTSTKSFARMKRARLEFMWHNCGILVHNKKHRYSFGDMTFYMVEKAMFGSYPNAIARVDAYKVDPANPCRRIQTLDSQMINKAEEFFEYFEDKFSDDDWRYYFQIPHVGFEAQKSIDLNWFMLHNNFINFESNLLLQVVNTHDYSHLTGTFDNFLRYLEKLIFDKPLTLSDKELIKDIMTMFKILPSSHSATSVSKMLRGLAGIKSAEALGLIGKYKDTLKQDQMFELAKAIQDYLYHNEIFVDQETYSSGKEWRGHFEYIGSKYIVIEKLDEIIQTME